MTPETADRLLAELLEALDEAEALLRRFGQDHWARWLSDARAQLLRRDGHGLVKLLHAYGGAGSINDIQLTARQRSGHRRRWMRRRRKAMSVESLEAIEMSDELHRHLSVAHQCASALLADLERPEP